MRAPLLALAFVLGCGGRSTPATAPPQPATCDDAAASMKAFIVRGRDNVDEEATAYATLIRTRCEHDAWSADARRCLAAMRTAADAERCNGMLTEEQLANLVRDQDAKQKPD